MAVENWQMPAIGAGAAFLGSIPQMVEARRLRKERERLMNEGAPGMSPIEQEQMAAAKKMRENIVINLGSSDKPE